MAAGSGKGESVIERFRVSKGQGRRKQMSGAYSESVGQATKICRLLACEETY